jgi:hypothetical protein
MFYNHGNSPSEASTTWPKDLGSLLGMQLDEVKGGIGCNKTACQEIMLGARSTQCASAYPNTHKKTAALPKTCPVNKICAETKAEKTVYMAAWPACRPAGSS